MMHKNLHQQKLQLHKDSENKVAIFFLSAMNVRSISNVLPSLVVCSSDG